jgi:hypothetical protein
MAMRKGNKQKSGKVRATHEEREDRFRDIEALMDKGHRPADIARAISHRYSITTRQAERDIQTVKERRSAYLLLSAPGELRAENYNLLKHLYKQCLQNGEHQTALKALSLQDKMLDKAWNQGDIKNEKSTDSTKIQSEDLANLMATLETDWPGE